MKCPNCNGEIGRFELAPECRHCGVNIFYSQQKTLLARDAKKCELEYATFRIIMAKIKANFINGPLQILRIIAMLMAIGSIFIPFATVSTDFTVINGKLSFGAWGIYGAFSDGTLAAIFNLREYYPVQAGICLALLVSMVLTVLMGLVIFVTLVLSFLNIQRGAKIMRGLAVIGALLCVISAVISFIMPSVVSQSAFLTAESGVGAIVCFLVFAGILILNHLVVKKKLQPQIDEFDIKRVEMRKRVKKGEISIDDLPLPVFESPEEKVKRIENTEKTKQVTAVEGGGTA